MLQDVASIVIMAYMKIIHIYLRSIYFPKTRSENDAWCVEKQTITVNRLREKWSQKKATPPSTILFQISSEVERLFLFLTAMKNVTAKRVTICQHEIHVIQQIAPENIQITPKQHTKNTRKHTKKQVLPVQTVVTSCEEQTLFGFTCRSHPTWNGLELKHHVQAHKETQTPKVSEEHDL